jgi:hypothetical protein
MTFQVYVKIGTWYRNDRKYHHDSTIRLWAAEAGRPSRLEVDQTGYDIANTDDLAAWCGKVFTPLLHRQEPRSAPPDGVHLL